MKRLALFTGGVATAITAAVVLYFLASGAKRAPGFIGPGTLAADINLALEIVLVLGLTFGFLLARAGNIEAHRINQTSWVLINAVLVALIMASSMQDVKPKGIADLGDTRIWVTWLHALVGAASAAAGVWLALQMNDILPRRLHIVWWKNLMRMTLAGYWVVALFGFVTYYFWYVA